MPQTCEECGAHGQTIVYGRKRAFRRRPRRRVCSNPLCVRRGQLRVLGVYVSPAGSHRAGAR